MSYVGTGVADTIRRPVFGNLYRDATASPKPQNANGMAYRDPNERGNQDYKLNGPKAASVRSSSYYNKVVERAKSQQNSPKTQYPDDEDDRVHNDLLEEIFNVQDSINLDYFELERQAIDPYDSAFGAGLTRLPEDFEQNDQVIHFAVQGAEEEGYKLLELQSKNDGCNSISQGNLVCQRPRKAVICDKPGSEIIAVASPTISSTCESTTASCGSIKFQPDSTSSFSGVDGTVAGVDSTTSSSNGTQTVTGNNESAQRMGNTGGQTRSSSDARENRPNIRPRAEHSTRNNRAHDTNGKVEMSTAASGESTATSSTSTSPSQIQVTKKQRTIECGNDLIADVRDSFEYVRGANLFSPSFHPTFSSFSADTNKGAVFQGSQYNSHMETAQLSSITTSRPSGNCEWDARCMASPGNIHMSCPDLASPLPHSPSLPQAAEFMPPSSVSLSQRNGALQGLGNQQTYDSFTSLSAPCTPSKRSAGQFLPRDHVRSPAAHQISTLTANKPGGHLLAKQLHQYEVNRLDQHVRSSSPSQRLSTACFPNPQLRNTGRHQKTFNENGEIHLSYAFSPKPRELLHNLQRSAVGTPLSQNTFLHGLINDKSSSFRSHRLFPLLRDIIIADMNFHTPSFPFQLICNLPADFNHLIQNYISRNPHLANISAGDASIESVFMDALSYAHSTLIGKIQMRKATEGTSQHSSSYGIEDFCETFDRSVNPVINEYSEMAGTNGYEHNDVLLNTYSGPPIQSRPSTPNMFHQPGHTAPSTPRSSSIQHQQPSYTAPLTPRGSSVQTVHHQQPNYMAPSTPRGSSMQHQQHSYSTPSTPRGSSMQHQQSNFAAPLTPRGSGNQHQQPCYTAPATPRENGLHHQQLPYSAPSTPRGYSTTPSGTMQRQQHIILQSTSGNNLHHSQDPSLTQHQDQKMTHYGFGAPTTQFGCSVQQQEMSGPYEYGLRYESSTSSNPDLATPLPHPGSASNLSQDLTAPLTPRSMVRSHDQLFSYTSSENVSRYQDIVAPMSPRGSGGHMDGRLSPLMSSGYLNRQHELNAARLQQDLMVPMSSNQHHQNQVAPMNTTRNNLEMMVPMNTGRHQHLIMSSNRSGSTNQLSDSQFISQQSIGRCINRNFDALDQCESARLDSDLPYLSRRQNNDRLIHSLPTSPHKMMQSSVNGSIMPHMYMGNSNMGCYSTNEYNLEKTNKSKVLPKEAVAIMTEWLREHQDNPYPNDDEKEALIISTRLTINQINYWFTNARRRVLPKWALQRHLDEQEQSRRIKSETTS